MSTFSDRPAGERPDEAGSPASPSTSGPSFSSGCELLESVSAELALGSLSGAERAAALGHLDECQSCRQLVEELTAAADSLLLIAAEADPPAGFEVRLLERLRAAGGTAQTISALTPASPGDSPPASIVPGTGLPEAAGSGGARVGTPFNVIDGGRPRSARRFTTRARVAFAAAAVAIAAAGVGLGLEVAPRPAPAVSAIGPVRIASLHTGNASSATLSGQVMITTGKPSWLLMTVDLHATGWVTCEVDVNGQEVPVGRFELYDGRGSWAVPLHESGADVTSARVVGSTGQVLASADLQA